MFVCTTNIATISIKALKFNITIHYLSLIYTNNNFQILGKKSKIKYLIN